MRLAMTFITCATLCHFATAQHPDVRRIHERFETAKPNAKSLEFYSLDWEMNLAAAKDRARKESRPIMLVINTNITAGTNFFSGHT